MDAHDFLLYESNMESRSSSAAIHNYNLFGELGELPDVAHCETISARSALHDWELALHRHARLYQVLLIESGGGEARLEEGTHALGAMDLVFVPAGHVHGFRFAPGTEGWVLTLAAELVDEIIAPAEGLRLILGAPIVRPAPPQLLTVMRQAAEEFSGRGFGRAHLLRAHCSAAIGLVAREASAGAAAAAATSNLTMVQRFQSMLEEHYLEHWSVSDYASALGITATHLSRVTRALHGRSATHLIVDRVVREARRNLAYTGLPVSSIAFSLGFKDPAYFTRVFSRAAGLSPSAFRERVQRARR